MQGEHVELHIVGMKKEKDIWVNETQKKMKYQSLTEQAMSIVIKCSFSHCCVYVYVCA
jgi:hypothetical protein